MFIFGASVDFDAALTISTLFEFGRMRLLCRNIVLVFGLISKMTFFFLTLFAAITFLNVFRCKDLFVAGFLNCDFTFFTKDVFAIFTSFANLELFVGICSLIRTVVL